jgi:hypothetical protein
MACRIQYEVAAITLADIVDAGVKGFNHVLILPFPCTYCNQPFTPKARNSSTRPG